MPTSLFTAPMEQITADDVHTFLDEELEEGPRRDYKQADPNHLIPQDVVDVICAFANTYGGLLILGVKADQTTNRPIERKGLPLVKEQEIGRHCYEAEEDLSPLELTTLKRALGINDTRWRTRWQNCFLKCKHIRPRQAPVRGDGAAFHLFPLGHSTHPDSSIAQRSH